MPNNQVCGSPGLWKGVRIRDKRLRKGEEYKYESTGPPRSKGEAEEIITCLGGVATGPVVVGNSPRCSPTLYRVVGRGARKDKSNSPIHVTRLWIRAEDHPIPCKATFSLILPLSPTRPPSISSRYHCDRNLEPILPSTLSNLFAKNSVHGLVCKCLIHHCVGCQLRFNDRKAAQRISGRPQGRCFS